MTIHRHTIKQWEGVWVCVNTHTGNAWGAGSRMHARYIRDYLEGYTRGMVGMHGCAPVPDVGWHVPHYREG